MAAGALAPVAIRRTGCYDLSAGRGYMAMAPLGKAIVTIGLIITACGLIVWAAPSIPLIGRFGRLPGDIFVRRGNFTFYFPLATSIVISVVLSLLFALMRR